MFFCSPENLTTPPAPLFWSSSQKNFRLCHFISICNWIKQLISIAPSVWVLFVVGMLIWSTMNSYVVKSIFCQSKFGLEEKSRYQIERLWWGATHPVLSPREVSPTTHDLNHCVHTDMAVAQRGDHNSERNLVNFTGNGVLKNCLSRWLCQETGEGYEILSWPSREEVLRNMTENGQKYCFYFSVS